MRYVINNCVVYVVYDDVDTFNRGYIIYTSKDTYVNGHGGNPKFFKNEIKALEYAKKYLSDIKIRNTVKNKQLEEGTFCYE